MDTVNESSKAIRCLTVSARPTVLIFPFPFLAHYLRCIVVARTLTHDYDVAFASHPLYNDYVLANGFTVFPCLTFDPEEVLEKFNRFDFSWLSSPRVEAIMLEHCDVIRRLSPLFVVNDNIPTLKITGEITRTPVISILNLYMTRWYAGTRKIPESHYTHAIVNNLPDFFKKALTRAGEAMAFRRIHTNFKRLREKYHLTSVSNYLAELEGDINLIADLPELFSSMTGIPSNCITVGPLIYNSSTIRAPFVRMLDRTKKTIFVSFGSTGDWNDVRMLASSCFSKYNIVTVGDRNGVLRQINGWHIPFISLSEVLPFVDLVVCHGGNGTIYQALLYGKPVLCCPSNFEQQWNVDAIETMGLGFRFSRAMPVVDFAALVETALGIHDYRIDFFAKSIREKQHSLKATVLQALNATLPVFKRKMAPGFAKGILR